MLDYVYGKYFVLVYKVNGFKFKSSFKFFLIFCIGKIQYKRSCEEMLFIYYFFILMLGECLDGYKVGDIWVWDGFCGECFCYVDSWGCVL